MMEFISFANRLVAALKHFFFVTGVLAQIAVMIETDRLQIDFFRLHLGEDGLVKNVGGDVLHRGVDNLVDEADVTVFAGGNPGHDFAPSDFGIDDGLAAAPPIVDHHNEVLHPAPVAGGYSLPAATIAENRNQVKRKIRKK